MHIDNNTLKAHEYLTALEDEIKELKKLINLKDSEIEILRDVLKEIGAEITSEVDKQLVYDDDWCVRAVRINEIYLRKAYVYPFETEEVLKKIEEVLEKYGKAR